MTIKELLKQDVSTLEAMSDDELRAYLQPFIKVVEAIRPAKSSSIIDVSEIESKYQSTRLTPDNIEQYIKDMQAKMASRVGGQDV